MINKIIFPLVLLLVACNYKIVKEDKYISTDSFREEAYKICVNSKKYKSNPERINICSQEARELIDSAARKYREYKADEHNYRLCRSKTPTIPMADNCFMKKQEKYYQRELAGYKSSLNK